MSDLQQVLRSRRSCRNFKPVMPSREDIDQVMGVGLYAPTGMGKQSTKIIAVTNKKLRDLIADENARIGGWKEGFDPFYGAPVILIVIADASCPTAVYDGSAALAQMMISAQDLGLSTCWIHRAKEEFDSEFGKKILKELGLNGNFVGIGHLALGFAAEPAAAPAPRQPDRAFYLE
ncbi:MAG: nitroreductase [Lachnospiraceae bacterium]|nr:nitroreductase [Lachnospiraceae bacterium]